MTRSKVEETMATTQRFEGDETMATTSTALRLVLRRPVQSATVWGGAGLGAGMALPSILASYGWIYSSSLVTTTACGGAIAILLPMGLARGVVSSLQLVLMEEGTVKKTVEELLSKDANTPSSIMALEHPRLLWEAMTFGGGWQGGTLRTIASPFLPSTAQMLTRMQESVDSGQTEAKVMAAAADGFVEGFLQDKKDTVTMIGVVAYAALLAVGIGVDYTYRKVGEGKQAMADSMERKKQKVRDIADKFKWKPSKIEEDDEATNQDVENESKDVQEKKQNRKDLFSDWKSTKDQIKDNVANKWRSLLGRSRKDKDQEDQESNQNGKG